MMNVLADILCDNPSLMVSSNFKETLSHNKIISSQDIGSEQGQLHLLGSQISNMERPLGSVNHSNMGIYNTAGQIHVPSSMGTGFSERNDMSVFSDSFPEIVPPWLTNDFMKVSETLSSPDILSNVSDIYPRENEHLEMLDLGFPPELTNQDVTSSGLSEIAESQKLLAELPIERFTNTNPLLMPSFHDMNVGELNTMQYEKFKQNTHMTSSSTIMNSVLPCENDLIHLHSNLTEQCLTTTSSPSILSNSQSQSHPVDVCDKLPHINLNHLDSFLDSGNALSQIQLLRQDFPNVRISDEVNCNQQDQVCLNDCGPPLHTERFLNSISKPPTQDISVQVSEKAFKGNLIADSCVSCSGVDSEAAVEVVQCFKCKFCDYVNLHKCAIESHINSNHSKSPNVLSETINNVEHDQRSNVNSMSSVNANTLSKSNNIVVTIAANVLSNGTIDPVMHQKNFQTSEHFKCLMCNKLFAEPASYNSHLTSEHNIHPATGTMQNMQQFECNKCQKLFVNANVYLSHLVSHHNLNGDLVKLDVNKGLLFTLSNGIVNGNEKVNMTLVTNNVANIPKEPSSNFKPIISKSHLKEVDDSTKKSNTRKNNDMSTSTSEKPLSSHKKAWQKKMRRELGSYICEFKGCNVRFRALDNLEYHRKCHVSGGHSFACPECGTAFENWYAIAGHLWRTHKNDMELHACDQCPFRTFSLSRLENIHKKIHLNECLFLCDQCGKGFKNKKQLQNHRVRHSKKNVKRNPEVQEIKCKICSTYFSSKVLLLHHQDTVHNLKLKTFMCNHCEYTTIKRDSLRMHMRQHTGEKPFECDQCDYLTSDHNSLRRHKMIHSGEKQYKCPYCPYSSIQASTYKAHLKKNHMNHDGVLFSCNICSFRTVKRETYIAHMKDHESLNMLQNVNNSTEVNISEETFPLAEAMDISLAHGDSHLIPYLYKNVNMQSFLNTFGINMVSVCQESAT